MTLGTSYIICPEYPNLMGADSLGWAKTIISLFHLVSTRSGCVQGLRVTCFPTRGRLSPGLLPAVPLGRPDHGVCRTERKAVSGWSPTVPLCGRDHANATAEWKGETSPSGFSNSID